MSEKTQWVNNEIVDISIKNEITWLKLKRSDGTTFPLKLLKGFKHGPIGSIFKTDNIVDRGKYKEQLPQPMKGTTHLVEFGDKDGKVKQVEVKSITPVESDAAAQEIEKMENKYIDSMVLSVVLEVWKSEHRKTDVPDIKFVAEHAANIINATKEIQ